MTHEPQMRRMFRLEALFGMLQAEAGTIPVPLVETLTMSTVVGPAMDKDTPFVRLAIVANMKDFWDDTNKRWKSGIVKVDISDVTWAGTEEAGEKMTITIQPPNFNPAHNVKTVDTPLVSADTLALGDYVHKTAINYGVPDPSAVLEADGSITLAIVDLELPDGTLSSSIVPTVTYTTAFTEVNAYSSMSGATDFTSDLAVGPENTAAWGTVPVAASSCSGHDYVAVQLRTVTSTVTGFGGATLQYANVPDGNVPPLNPASYPLPETASRLLTLPDRRTWVLALNASGTLIDQNGTPYQQVGAGTQFGLFNFGLQSGGAKASVTVGYSSVVGDV